MANAVGIDLGAKPLCDDIDVVILKILCNARDKSHTDGGRQQQADASEELAGRVFAIAGRVLVDDVAKDYRIQEREDLVHRCQNEDQKDHLSMGTQIRI